MCQWTGSSLVQVMVCSLLSTTSVLAPSSITRPHWVDDLHELATLCYDLYHARFYQILNIQLENWK